MYQKFSNYREQRDDTQLYQKLDLICESLVYSKIDFKEFWEQCGLPIMLQSEGKKPEEVLNEINEGIGGAIGGALGTGLGTAARWAGQGLNALGTGALQGAQQFGKNAAQSWNPNAAQNPAAAPPQDPAAAAAPPQAPPQIDPAKAQAFMKKNVDPIKQEFGRAIQDFQKNAQRIASKSPDQQHSWQTAAMLSKAANQWLNSWQPNLKQGQKGQQPGYMSAYQKAQQQHPDMVGMMNKWQQGQQAGQAAQAVQGSQTNQTVAPNYGADQTWQYNTQAPATNQTYTAQAPPFRRAAMKAV